MPKLSKSMIVIGALYIAFACALVAMLVVARGRAIADTNPANADVSWQDWRAEAKRQQEGNGPVSRRVPKSTEPPTRVLLRDHFATSLTILLGLSSALFFAVAFMVRGAMLGPGFQPDLLDESTTNP